MLKRNYNVESIIEEYKRKKKYERKFEMKKFQEDKCAFCKNKKTNKCHITRDINNKLICVFYENIAE